MSYSIAKNSFVMSKNIYICMSVSCLKAAKGYILVINHYVILYVGKLLYLSKIFCIQLLAKQPEL